MNEIWREKNQFDLTRDNISLLKTKVKLKDSVLVDFFCCCCINSFLCLSKQIWILYIGRDWCKKKERKEIKRRTMCRSTSSFQKLLRTYPFKTWPSRCPEPLNAIDKPMNDWMNEWVNRTRSSSETLHRNVSGERSGLSYKHPFSCEIPCGRPLFHCFTSLSVYLFG